MFDKELVAFNSQDADVTIQSSDGVLFHMHRKNLESHTGAFPGQEINTRNELVCLTEPAKVIEIVFQFVYPRRYPFTLDHLDFDLLLEVAEAIEKYEVFWAMKPSEECLAGAIPQHASEILNHAVKHSIPHLIEKAVQALVLSPLEILNNLPAHLILPFIEYQKNWRDKVFGSAFRHLESQTYCGDSYCNDLSTTTSADICRICHVCLLAWISQLQKNTNLTSLRAALKSPILDTRNPTSTYNWCRNCRGNHCQNIPALVRVIEKAMEGADPFKSFT